MTPSCSTSATPEASMLHSQVAPPSPQEPLCSLWALTVFFTVIREPGWVGTQQEHNTSLGKERGKGSGKEVGESENPRTSCKGCSPSASVFPPPQTSAPTSFPRCASSPSPPGASPAALGAAASPLQSDV